MHKLPFFKLRCFVIILLFRVINLPGQQDNSSQYLTHWNQSSTQAGFLDTLLLNKKIVALGELDHGDGTSFVVKTEFIKYLHEQLGYHTLVMESGLINAFFMQQALNQQQHFRETVRNNLYYIWSEAAEMQPLFDYLLEQQQKGTPLKIVGIDPQFSGAENTAQFIDLLQNTLSKETTSSPSFADFIHELTVMSRWLDYPKKKEHKMTAAAFAQYCDTLLNELSSVTTREVNPALWSVFFQNIKTMGQIKWEKKPTSFEIRDRQMFDNTCFWMDQYPGEKFILWAANAHIIRHDRELTGAGSQYYLVGLKKTGDHLSGKLKSDYFSIGIAARSGATLEFLNTQRKHKLDDAASLALETLVNTPSPCFIHLATMERALNLERYEAGMLYTNIRCVSTWSRHYDGCIFIPVMEPSTPLWKN
ncbi:MAG: erythromycin esterase family protein [Saprospiraceae bacterium]|nr:erythromycin esterase family protein [Saprospiraceae bacterium]